MAKRKKELESQSGETWVVRRWQSGGENLMRLGDALANLEHHAMPPFLRELGAEKLGEVLQSGCTLRTRLASFFVREEGYWVERE